MFNDRKASAMIATAVMATLAMRDTNAYAAPGVSFDLRVHDTGSKDVVIASPGDSVVLDLYARAWGDDSNAANDGMIAAVGSFRSGKIGRAHV